MATPAPPPIPLPLLVERVEPLRAGLALHPPEARRNWMQGLGLWQLRALWYLAGRDPLPLTLDDLAPADGGVTVCAGKNHLPVFAWFEKRFARVGDQVVGYNETGWQKLFVGPGHFTVRPSEAHPHELLIDYGTVPQRTHPDFPALRDNDALGWPGPLARVVYGGGMTDRLRRVAPTLLIGKAVAGGPISLQGGAVFALFLPPRGADGLSSPGP